MSPHVEKVLEISETAGLPPEVKTELRRMARRMDFYERTLDAVQDALDGMVTVDKPWRCDGSGCGEMVQPDKSLHWVCRGSCSRNFGPQHIHRT